MKLLQQMGKCEKSDNESIREEQGNKRGNEEQEVYKTVRCRSDLRKVKGRKIRRKQQVCKTGKRD